MRSFIYILLTIQLTLVVGQITFTREWVNGKRNSPSNVFSSHQNNPEYPPCKSLWPAIEILMETEKLQEAHCGTRVTPSKFLVHYKNIQPKAAGSKQQEDESVQFEDDLLPSSKNP